jgi:toxin-antitoxin system PIN domain toxin
VKIIDGNILIYAANTNTSQHLVCRQWLETALNGPEEIGFNWVAINGFLRVSTQRAFAAPLSVKDAVAQMEQWLNTPVARIVEERPDHWATFKQLLLAVGTGGNLTTDAHLAALAISHNATLVSCDTDFARFKRLRWENPFAVP